jgi:hypothetical protein
MVESTRRLLRALGSLAGHRSRAARRGARILADAVTWLADANRLFPHLLLTPSTAEPSDGWQEHLDALEAAHPEWRAGIALDREFLANREADLASLRRLRVDLAERLAKLNSLIARAEPFAAALGDELVELCEWRDEVGQAHDYYTGTPSPPSLADMPVQGTA